MHHKQQKETKIPKKQHKKLFVKRENYDEDEDGRKNVPKKSAHCCIVAWQTISMWELCNCNWIDTDSTGIKVDRDRSQKSNYKEFHEMIFHVFSFFSLSFVHSFVRCLFICCCSSSLHFFSFIFLANNAVEKKRLRHENAVWKWLLLVSSLWLPTCSMIELIYIIIIPLKKLKWKPFRCSFLFNTLFSFYVLSS